MEDLAPTYQYVLLRRRTSTCTILKTLWIHQIRLLCLTLTDRATLNGILERTDAYATGSGFLDAQSVNGITVIPLGDNLDNKMVYVRRKGINLSSCALKFVNVMFDYFDTYKP